jgi:hypothetical protein
LALVGENYSHIYSENNEDYEFSFASPCVPSKVMFHTTALQSTHVGSYAFCWRKQEAVRDMFRKFVMRIKPGGLLLVNGDR